MHHASATVLAHHAGETEWPPLGMYEIGGTDSYTIVNLRVAYRFLEDRAEAGVNVFNLLDSGHYEYPLADQVKRQITGTLRVTF